LFVIVLVACCWLIGRRRRLRCGGIVKADWEKAVEAAKQEGQLTLYGSPDFEGLFGEFHKKYPEIKITGVFNRGADVAKRLMAERRAEKYLADLYVNGMTTGYNVFIRQRRSTRSACARPS